MTAPVLDRNAQFTAERQAQMAAAASSVASLEARVAAGELKKLPDGRYKVIADGWDTGEILTAQGMPVTQLDMTTGQAAFYGAQPAWHGLGSVIPGGTSDIDTVLNLGGIAFGVHTVPAEYLWNGERRSHEGFFHTVRDDTGAALGVVGKRYEKGGVIQNRAAFEFLEDLVNRPGGVTWDSAGALYDGRKVFVTMRVPTEIRIDPQGINDEIVPYIVAINSHDGSSQFQVVATPWRVECANTERFAVRDASAHWKVRHTRRSLTRIQEARITLGLSDRYFEAFAEEETALAQTDLAIDEFKKVIDDLWPLQPGASDQTVKNAAKRTALLGAVFDRYSEKLGRTAYAGERAITEFLDHRRQISPTGSLKGKMAAARATQALDGAEDERKAKAHKRLMLLTRR